MYHPDITAAIARQHYADLMTEAKHAKLAREARSARHTTGTAPRTGRRAWVRLIPQPKES